MVDFADSPEQATFREEVLGFINDNLPQRLRVTEDDDAAPEGGRSAATDDRADALAEWRSKLVEKGWIAPAWPKEYGGADLTTMEQYILAETFTLESAPRLTTPDVGSTLMVHGSDDQKSEFLPGMVSGAARWCQGYSEPGSGSDLASLQTRAVRDGDDFVINGQKIWTSGAHLANMMFAMVRTDPEAPKHRGISYLLLSMDTPGITVRPLVQMSDARGFNEVFFEDVRVPAKNVVGEINRGWYVGATHLDFERSNIGRSIGHQRELEAFRRLILAEEAADSGKSTLSRAGSERLELVDRFVEASIAKTISQRVISMQARGEIPNYEASMSKLFSSELNQRISRTATRLLGLYGALRSFEDEHTPVNGRWATLYLSTVSRTIAAGSSEIQRNVIATRGLGLPRG